VKMNRRSFLKALVSAAGAVAATPYVPSIIREPVVRWHNSQIEALAASMLQTKEIIAGNVLNRAFGDSVFVYGDAKDADDG